SETSRDKRSPHCGTEPRTGLNPTLTFRSPYITTTRSGRFDCKLPDPLTAQPQIGVVCARKVRHITERIGRSDTAARQTAIHFCMRSNFKSEQTHHEFVIIVCHLTHSDAMHDIHNDSLLSNLTTL